MKYLLTCLCVAAIAMPLVGCEALLPPEYPGPYSSGGQVKGSLSLSKNSGLWYTPWDQEEAGLHLRWCEKGETEGVIEVDPGFDGGENLPHVFRKNFITVSAKYWFDHDPGSVKCETSNAQEEDIPVDCHAESIATATRCIVSVPEECNQGITSGFISFSSRHGKQLKIKVHVFGQKICGHMQNADGPLPEEREKKPTTTTPVEDIGSIVVATPVPVAPLPSPTDYEVHSTVYVDAPEDYKPER